MPHEKRLVVKGMTETFIVHIPFRGSGPATASKEFYNFVKAEVEKWSPVVKRAGMIAE